MVILEALNALAGDCLLLRYPGPDGKERLWIVDGGPKSDKKKNVAVWRDVLLPRLKEINHVIPVPVALGMVSHIDDDHINGIQKLTSTLVAARPGAPGAVRFARFWFNSFDELVGPKPADLPEEVAAASLESLVCDENLPRVDDDRARLIMQSIGQGNNLAADLRSLQLNGNVPVGDFIMAKRDSRSLRSKAPT